MGKKIGEIKISDQFGWVYFFMDGNRLAAVYKDNRFWIEDSEIKDEHVGESSVKRQYFDGEIIGLEPGKNIRIPYSVLKTRDVSRVVRQNDPDRQYYKFIYEQYEQFGLIEFCMFETLFLIWHEGKTATIEDTEITLTDQGIRVPSKFKEIPVPYLYIPEAVLKTRDKIRNEIEYNSHFTPICIQEGITFLLNDNSELVMRYGKREAVASEIENIYGKPAVKAEALELGHPYLLLPIKVEDAFRRAQGNKIPAGLKLDFAGVSLLNGKEYFKFDRAIPEAVFDRVRLYFEYYGEASDDFSGWLTSQPDKVEAALNLN